MSDEDVRPTEELRLSVAAKQGRLFELYETTWPDAFEELQRAERLAIVVTSNALDGNSLSALETATILNQGTAIGGKSLEHNIQAFDHGEALDFASEIASRENLAERAKPVRPGDLQMLNWQLGRRAPRDHQSTFAHPDGDEPKDGIDHPPKSVVDLCAWLKTQPDTPRTAIEAHNWLMRAQPFVNHNGTTARLLLNFILMRGGYPPIAIQPEHALEYKRAVKDCDDATIEKIVLSNLDQTLDRYIDAAEQYLAANPKTDREP